MHRPTAATYLIEQAVGAIVESWSVQGQVAGICEVVLREGQPRSLERLGLGRFTVKRCQPLPRGDNQQCAQREHTGDDGADDRGFHADILFLPQYPPLLRSPDPHTLVTRGPRRPRAGTPQPASEPRSARRCCRSEYATDRR